MPRLLLFEDGAEGAWEEKHWPIDPPDPIQAILFAMEHRGLSLRALEPPIGSRARVAEVLNHKRSLTLPMIRRLHEGLGFLRKF